MMIYLSISFDSIIQSGKGIANAPLFLNIRIAYRHLREQASVNGRHCRSNRNIPYESLRRFHSEKVVQVLVIDFLRVIRSDAQTTT